MRPFLKRSAWASQPNGAYSTSLRPHATSTGTLTFADVRGLLLDRVDQRVVVAAGVRVVQLDRRRPGPPSARCGTSCCGSPPRCGRRRRSSVSPGRRDRRRASQAIRWNPNSSLPRGRFENEKPTTTSAFRSRYVYASVIEIWPAAECPTSPTRLNFARLAALRPCRTRPSAGPRSGARCPPASRCRRSCRRAACRWRRSRAGRPSPTRARRAPSRATKL